MWNCPKCGESLEDIFDACWKCAGCEPPPLPNEDAAPVPEPETPAGPAEPPRQRLAFETFSPSFRASLETVMQQAADFATRIGPDRVVNISFSPEGHFQLGVVVVWYWQPTTAD